MDGPNQMIIEFIFSRSRKETIGQMLEICVALGIEPKMKGAHMDVNATLLLIISAINALKAASAPTSNFATDDVKDNITTAASALGVTPVQLAPAAPTT